MDKTKKDIAELLYRELEMSDLIDDDKDLFVDLFVKALKDYALIPIASIIES